MPRPISLTGERSKSEHRPQRNPYGQTNRRSGESAPSANRFSLSFTCVQLSPADVPDLHAMCEAAVDIEFSTFARHCNWQPVARELGYTVGPGEGLRIANDYTVRFKRSVWRGQRCYYIDWSRIEHVFLDPHAVTG